MLKLEVRDYMMEMEKIEDFVPVIDTVSQMVADKFVRKQFADFNYLQIELSKAGTIILWILNIGFFITSLCIANQMDEQNYRSRYHKSKRRFYF